MASKALPALVLLALVCGELAIAGHAQALIGGGSSGSRMPPLGLGPLPYIGGTGRASAGGGSPAGMQPPTDTTPASGYDGTGRVNVPGVEDEKAFMIHSVPAHDRARPVPVPPTAN